MQLKSLIASLMALGFLISPVFAGEGHARIDLDASAGKLDFVQPKNKKIRIGYGTWIKDEIKKTQYVTTDLIVNDEKWTEVSFEVTPTQDCKLMILLRGQWSKKQKNWVYFDDISIEGADIKNGGFEKKGKWLFPPKAQLILDKSLAHSGKGAILVWHDIAARQTVSVKGGVPLTITAWVKFCKQEDKEPPAKESSSVGIESK